MNVKALKDIPPWKWPDGAGKMFLDILRDGRAAAGDRLLAAELAGDFTVVNDELADALLAVLRSGGESAALRGKAAISPGPVLEHADTQGFEDADDVPIGERAFHGIQESLRTLSLDAAWPHLTALVTSGTTDKPLLLAAIEAVARIRPHEAAEILDDLTDSDDEDIVDAVFEATAMAEGPSDEDDEPRH